LRLSGFEFLQRHQQPERRVQHVDEARENGLVRANEA
jgi:hypothetical protein